MTVLDKIEYMRRSRRRSAIHCGPGLTYPGPLPEISLSRGSPRCWLPPIGGIGWAVGEPLMYPPACGRPELRGAVAGYLNERIGLSVDADEILATNGATQAIDVVSSCLREHKRRRSPLTILFPTPTWMTIPFNQILEKGGRCCQFASTFDSNTGDWTMDMDLFEFHLQQQPDAVFLVQPSNPTGQLASWLGDAFELLASYDVACILDVTYESMRHDGEPLRLPWLPANRRNVFLIGSLSKRYAAPGLRVAYLVPPPEYMPTCCDEIEIGTMGVSVLSQDFAARLLAHDLETDGAWFRSPLSNITKRCRFVGDRLTAMGFSVTRPEAGYYVFGKLPDDFPLSAREFRRALYERFGVDSIPGDEFGDAFSRFIRLSVANPPTFDEVKEACDRIEAFLQN